MQKRLEELFKELTPARPPHALAAHIVETIKTREIRRARFAFFSSCTLAVVSIAGLIPAIRYFAASAATSGFGDYLSLAISDNANLIKYWTEFSLTLVESIPLIALAIVLAALCALLWSATRAAKNARTALLAI